MQSWNARDIFIRLRAGAVFVADYRQIRERKRQEIWDQLELLIRDAKGTGITMLEFQEQVIQSYGSEEGGNRNDKG